MKKLISMILALALVFALTMPALAESIPIDDLPKAQARAHAVYTCYNGSEVYGLMEVPEDGVEYWVRLTFFLPHDDFFLLIVPIGPDGTFQAYICTDCVHLAVQIVDEPCAIAPGSFTVYDALEEGAVLW